MSINSFGHLFRVTTWGEKPRPALGGHVDWLPPPVVTNTEEMIQQIKVDGQAQTTGQNKYNHAAPRSGRVGSCQVLFEGVTTGTPDPADDRETEQRSKDYTATSRDKFRPRSRRHHVNFQKYGHPRIIAAAGGHRHVETASRVAAGGLAREAIQGDCPESADSPVTWCRWARIK